MTTVDLRLLYSVSESQSTLTDEPYIFDCESVEVVIHDEQSKTYDIHAAYTALSSHHDPTIGRGDNDISCRESIFDFNSILNFQINLNNFAGFQDQSLTGVTGIFNLVLNCTKDI